MPIAFTCEQCGDVFSAPASRRPRYCSRACTTAHRQARGFPVTVARITMTCAQCGAGFDVLPSRATGTRKRRCCSGACDRAFKRAQSGSQSPRYVGPMTQTCEWCAASYSIPRAWANRPGKPSRFCSGTCRASWVSRTRQRRVSRAEVQFADTLAAAGLCFERQAQVGRYTADVCFADARLLVEFDGDYWHDLPRVRAKDARKDAELQAAGYTVLRIRQREYEADPAAAIARVRAALTLATEVAA